MPKHGLCDNESECFEVEPHGLLDVELDQQTIAAFERLKIEHAKESKRQKRKERVVYWSTIVAAVAGIIAAIASTLSLFR